MFAVWTCCCSLIGGCQGKQAAGRQSPWVSHPNSWCSLGQWQDWWLGGVWLSLRLYLQTAVGEQEFKEQSKSGQIIKDSLSPELWHCVRARLTQVSLWVFWRNQCCWNSLACFRECKVNAIIYWLWNAAGFLGLQINSSQFQTACRTETLDLSWCEREITLSMSSPPPGIIFPHRTPASKVWLKNRCCRACSSQRTFREHRGSECHGKGKDIDVWFS